MTNRSEPLFLVTIVMCLIGGAMPQAAADDTEIFMASDSDNTHAFIMSTNGPSGADPLGNVMQVANGRLQQLGACEDFGNNSGENPGAIYFTAPAVPVNAFNRTRHLPVAYASVFTPSRHPRWTGNLNKYNDISHIVHDDNDQENTTDGQPVFASGAAAKIPTHINRRVYTNLASGELTTADNRIAVSNSGITAAMLGAPNRERINVIEWLRGRDLLDEDHDDDTSDDRNLMGDPLHVRPVTVNYGGTAAAPDTTVFISTNDGYFHAIDPDDGRELWSFIPSRLLNRFYDLYLNDLAGDRKGYGLDGNIAVFIKNNDGLPGLSATEEVILLFGMRRGGTAIFALNVTDRDQPKLLWEIDDTDLPDLGQTWSTPRIVQVNIGGTKKTVAIFAGGYDPAQDRPGYRTDTRGNAVYMVDLDTGARIWSAGHSTTSVGPHDLWLPDMQHSIPAPITVIDLTQDGLADRMYVGDMGGRVWRFDIINGNRARDLVEGGVLASLGAAESGAAASATDIRRFYASPDVVPVMAPMSQNKPYLAINIGSGYRAHPLWSAVHDEFFSLRDFDVFNTVKTEDYGAPTLHDDLRDITDNLKPVLPPDATGWRLSMSVGTGEKILGESFTFRKQTFFVSFTPNTDAIRCGGAPGVNRLYRINVGNGTPVVNLDGNPTHKALTSEDRHRQLAQGGIAPEPIFIFPPDMQGDPLICVGLECLDPEISTETTRTYWIQDATQ